MLQRGVRMKRLALLLPLIGIILVASASPAWAYYAPKQNTAYIYIGTSNGWAQWAGPSDPLSVIKHTDAIPHGWPVVVSYTWVDGEIGARLAPAVLRETLSFRKQGGGWTFAVTDPAKTVKYWSPEYQWDATKYPGIWAMDWCVPLGKLKPGSYSGWTRDQALGPVPSWLDAGGNLVTTVTWLKPWDNLYKHTFKVK